MYIDDSIESYNNKIDSKMPTPGGGSVAALVGSLAACLARMTGHFTIDKQSFINLDSEDKISYLESFDQLHLNRLRFEKLIDVDCENFELIMQAYRLSRKTPEEQSTRVMTLDGAAIAAVTSLQEMIELSIDSLLHLTAMAQYSNVSLLSDMACATHLFNACIECSIINIKVNLDIVVAPEQYQAYIRTVLKQKDLLVNSALKNIAAKQRGM